jgi:transcription factor MBP1
MAKFDDLVRTYETESKAKDREYMQVNAMLTSFENEIEEGAKELEALKTRGQDLDARKALLRQLESESRSRLAKRCRAGLDKWMTYEEEREKKVWASNMATPQTIAKLSPTALKGKSREEDISDLAELYSGLPKSQSDIAAACKELRAELQSLQRQQVALLEEYAKAQAESGTGARMADYRRLISAALNDVAPEEVDDIVPILLEVSQVLPSSPYLPNCS